MLRKIFILLYNVFEGIEYTKIFFEVILTLEDPLEGLYVNDIPWWLYILRSWIVYHSRLAKHISHALVRDSMSDSLRIVIKSYLSGGHH